jgi:hypothetical protein
MTDTYPNKTKQNKKHIARGELKNRGGSSERPVHGPKNATKNQHYRKPRGGSSAWAGRDLEHLVLSLNTPPIGFKSVFIRYGLIR